MLPVIDSCADGLRFPPAGPAPRGMASAASAKACRIGFVLFLTFALAVRPIAGIRAAEISTADGLSIKLSDSSGRIEAVNVDGAALPLLSDEAGGVILHEIRRVAVKKNLVPNPGFEEGEKLAAGWPFVGQGTSREGKLNHTPGGRFCAKAVAPEGSGPDKPGSSGQFRTIVIPAKPRTTYAFSAWGMVPEGSSGGNVFVVELDKDGKVLWSGGYHVQHGLGWRGSTGGKWTRKDLTFVSRADCARFHVYGNVWEGYGAFYFDDVELFETLSQETIVPQAAVTESEDGTGWEQHAALPEKSLDLRVKYLARDRYIRVDVELRETSAPMKERAVQVLYVLPVRLDGWTWHDDGRRSRTVDVEQSSCCENTFPIRGHNISCYPFASITKGDAGLSLAVPMECPRLQRFFCDPKLGYATAVDLGLSPVTDRIGRGRATFTTVIYKHPADWGFRAAAKKYYDIFPRYFERRIERGGLWFFAVPITSVPRPEEFGITFYECGGLSKRALDLCKEKDIMTFHYIEPWGAWQFYPDSDGTKPSYDERVKLLREWAEDKSSDKKWLNGPRRQIAQAVLNSSPLKADGSYHIDSSAYFWHQWGKWAQNWPTNPNPNLPMPNRGVLCKKYELDPFLKERTGVYVDSVSATSWGWSGLPNYRKEHFKFADIPPSFSADTAAPVLVGCLSQYEFLRWLWFKLRADDKLVMMNIFPTGYRFYAHFCDLLGSEVSGIEDDKISLLRRTMSYQKPNSNLLQWGWGGGKMISHEQMRDYIKHEMFYGIFPGVGSGGGRDKGYPLRYFSNPDLRERDRKLFMKFVPVIRRLHSAGWEPVTRARTSDEDVFVERFGYWEKNNLHFTLRNEGDKEKKFDVTVSLCKLGAKPDDLAAVAVKDVLTGSALSSKSDAKAGTITFSFKLPPNDSGVVSVLPGGGD